MDFKHSRLGIASFALSSAAALGAFGLIAITAILKTLRHGNHDVRALGHVLFALCLCTLLFTNLVALGLGIAGGLQSERKKLFATLGIVFASLQILGIILLVVVLANA